MTYFKPGDKVVLSKEYVKERSDIAQWYKGILMVSLDVNHEGYFKVYRSEGGSNFLPADSYRFKLANPIWLKQKG